MRTAYSPDRTTRYALAGSDDTVAADIVVSGAEARTLARSGMLTCDAAHCDAPLHFRQSAADAFRPHWAHNPGTALHCPHNGSAEGRFHLAMKHLLRASFAQEYSLRGARVDVVISRPHGGSLIGVEIQHSPIRPEPVRRRHAAHAAAGLASTIWILNRKEFGRAGTHESSESIAVASGWRYDLLEACMQTEGNCTVALADEDLKLIWFVDRVSLTDGVDGARIAQVTKLSKPVSFAALEAWAAGPSRVMPEGGGAEFASLDAAHQRRVKPTKASALQLLGRSATGRPRIGPNTPHTDLMNAAALAGFRLTKGAKTFRDGASAAYGYLWAESTTATEAFMEGTFGAAWAPFAQREVFAAAA